MSQKTQDQMPEDLNKTRALEEQKRQHKTAQLDEDKKETDRIERMKKKQQ